MSILFLHLKYQKGETAPNAVDVTMVKRNLRSEELVPGKHIYFCDNAKGGKKHFKEGTVLSRYKTFVTVQAKSTFMGSSKTYNICLNYTDIDSAEGNCIVKEFITGDEVETKEDILAELI